MVLRSDGSSVNLFQMTVRPSVCLPSLFVPSFLLLLPTEIFPLICFEANPDSPETPRFMGRNKPTLSRGRGPSSVRLSVIDEEKPARPSRASEATQRGRTGVQKVRREGGKKKGLGRSCARGGKTRNVLQPSEIAELRSKLHLYTKCTISQKIFHSCGRQIDRQL